MSKWFLSLFLSIAFILTGASSTSYSDVFASIKKASSSGVSVDDAIIDLTNDILNTVDDGNKIRILLKELFKSVDKLQKNTVEELKSMIEVDCTWKYDGDGYEIGEDENFIDAISKELNKKVITEKIPCFDLFTK